MTLDMFSDLESGNLYPRLRCDAVGVPGCEGGIGVEGFVVYLDRNTGQGEVLAACCEACLEELIFTLGSRDNDGETWQFCEPRVVLEALTINVGALVAPVPAHFPPGYRRFVSMAHIPFHVREKVFNRKGPLGRVPALGALALGQRVSFATPREPVIETQEELKRIFERQRAEDILLAHDAVIQVPGFGYARIDQILEEDADRRRAAERAKREGKQEE